MRLVEQLFDRQSADRVDQRGADLGQGLQHEQAGAKARMGYDEPWLVDDLVAEEDEVEVEGARRVPVGTDAPSCVLESLERGEQFPRRQLAFTDGRGIEKWRLFPWNIHGRRLDD